MESDAIQSQSLINTICLFVVISTFGFLIINQNIKIEKEIEKLQEPPREVLVENVQYLTPSSSPKLDGEGNVIEGEFVDELKQVLVPVFRGYKEID